MVLPQHSPGGTMKPQKHSQGRPWEENPYLPSAKLQWVTMLQFSIPESNWRYGTPCFTWIPSSKYFLKIVAYLFHEKKNNHRKSNLASKYILWKFIWLGCISLVYHNRILQCWNICTLYLSRPISLTKLVDFLYCCHRKEWQLYLKGTRGILISKNKLIELSRPIC